MADLDLTAINHIGSRVTGGHERMTEVVDPREASPRPAPPSTARQSVDRYFRSIAPHGRDVDAADGLGGAIQRLRRSVALELIDDLHVPRGARVLEIGCGAGSVTAELATRGLVVDTVDTVDTLLAWTRSRVREANVGNPVTASGDDVHRLDFHSRVFSLVVALGVLPWLHSPGIALAEIGRVLDRGGHLVISSENRLRLINLLDPRLAPLFSLSRKALRCVLAALGLRTASAPSVRPRLYSRRQLDGLLAAAGLRRIKSLTLGFGPFSLEGYTLLSDGTGAKLHQALQWLADRGMPGLRATGAQHLVVAQRVK